MVRVVIAIMTVVIRPRPVRIRSLYCVFLCQGTTYLFRKCRLFDHVQGTVICPTLSEFPYEMAAYVSHATYLYFIFCRESSKISSTTGSYESLE